MKAGSAPFLLSLAAALLVLDVPTASAQFIGPSGADFLVPLVTLGAGSAIAVGGLVTGAIAQARSNAGTAINVHIHRSLWTFGVLNELMGVVLVPVGVVQAVDGTQVSAGIALTYGCAGLALGAWDIVLAVRAPREGLRRSALSRFKVAPAALATASRRSAPGLVVFGRF